MNYSSELNGIPFTLKKERDFTWLNQHGEVFSVMDQTGSGCICFGICRDGRKYFYKIAGADTVNGEVTPAESIRLLEQAVTIYRAIEDPALIRLYEDFTYGNLYGAVFEWAEGECLFDHWNFEMYRQNPEMDTPMKKFRRLPLEKKLETADTLIRFLNSTVQAGYAMVDLYDGSLIFDFESGQMKICDIDLFRKMPVINDAGTDWFGTKRLKAPEENQKGAVIDEKTGMFTVSALILDLLSEEDSDNKKLRYRDGHFIPRAKELFSAGDRYYEFLTKGASFERSERFETMDEYIREWEILRK